MKLQKLGQLGVAHQLGLIVVQLGHERFFVRLHIFQMLLQRSLIETQHRLGEHTHGQVDKLELLLGEPFQQLHRQLIGQLGVIDAVVAIALQLLRREVQPALTQRANYLVTFHAQPVPLGQLS